MPKSVYGNKPETILRASPRSNARRVNHVLLGTILEVRGTRDDWLKVDSLGKGKSGWVHKDDVRDTPVLKVFFVDVGQGDGAIVESPEGIMLVDGGPNKKNFYKFMKSRYRRFKQVEIKAMVVSHPDYDHYNGLTYILEDDQFKVGTIYHNGIIRYNEKYRPACKNFDLGKLSYKTVNGDKRYVLIDTFDTLSDAKDLIKEDLIDKDLIDKDLCKDGHLASSFCKFWKAALCAQKDGRLEKAKRITVRDGNLPGYDQPGYDQDDNNNKLFVEILGPVPTKSSGSVEYIAFPDAHDIADEDPTPSASHTRNGHSIVLKLKFGKHTILLGGDLNIPAQQHLMQYYENNNPFRVDVAKACHHGSSDFHVEFLKKVLPQVNVFSSGDNKSFDHPMADAVGAIARHTRGSHPLLFSTELARATSGDKIHYGLINLRSNGDTLVMAQMKEQHKNKADVWDSFEVPWEGKFAEAIKKSES